MLRRALVNRRTNTITWSFIEDRWDDINATFPASSIERLLTGIRTLSHPDLAPRIAGFLTDHRPPQAARAIDQHLELLAAHRKLRERAAELLARELS